MTRRPRPCYDLDEFRRDWWDTSTPLRIFAAKYGVSIASISRAARRRGFPSRYEIGGTT